MSNPHLEWGSAGCPSLAAKGGHTVAWSVWYTRSLRQNLYMVNIDALLTNQIEIAIGINCEQFNFFFSPKKYCDPNCQPL